MTSTRDTKARFFAGLIGAGLAIEAIELAWFGPGSFVAFALVGLPAIAVGAGYFAVHAISIVTRKDGAQ